MPTDKVDLEIVGSANQLTEFRRLIGRRGGLRIARSDGEMIVEINVSAIHRVGPMVEAVAGLAGAGIRLVELDASIEVAGPDERPSRVWAAISDAADLRDIARERGDKPIELIAFVGVEEQAGRRVAVSTRPHIVDPVDSSALWRDGFENKLDDADYHIASAIERGYPEEHGWTHIALYLTWLMRNDLIDRRSFESRDIAAVNAGAVVGGEIITVTMDQKLLLEMLTEDGAEFSRANYKSYLDAYSQLPGEDYSHPADAETYALLKPVLDHLWEAWGGATST